MAKTTIVCNLSKTLAFVSDSQDAEQIKQDIGPDAEGYDSFFVGTAAGDYTEIWGMTGIIPFNSKLVTKLL